jgi:uncharacterized protein YpmS
MFTLEFYISDETTEDTNYALDLTTSETQQLKALLNKELSNLEEDRAMYKHVATNLSPRDVELKNKYWKFHQQATKQINKLAKIQQKIKRSL